MNILFATSEAVPLIKTGGLADVSGSLPPAIKALGQDIRLILPGYPETKQGHLDTVAAFKLRHGRGQGHILKGHLPGSDIPLYLVDLPEYFDRVGTPYCEPSGGDWVDNPQRFAAFGRVISQIAVGEIDLGWQPQVVHCNDWQTGLAPALLAQYHNRPASVFTIHNIAYQGLYDWQVYHSLGLSSHFWSPDGMEFYNNFSFIKGGLSYADWITTVSPSYAREIRTPEFSYGLGGLLRHRARHLTGILNGADYALWSPENDVHIAQPYSLASLQDKALNKRDLQAKMGLPLEPKTPLLASIGRLVEQKGVDLILHALPRLLDQGVQFVLLGSGDPWLERMLQAMAADYPAQCKLTIGYNEPLAHQIEAGADMFLMPSRFEPCGLNQIYSLKYGTIPIVGRTGGLLDTVVDATSRHLHQQHATGFVLDEATPDALVMATERALALYHKPDLWQQLMATAMAQTFDWSLSAEEYVEVYDSAIASRNAEH